MKVSRETNEKTGKDEIRIVLTPDDAGLLQTAANMFAEKTAHCKQHHARMRRLAILIDKKI